MFLKIRLSRSVRHILSCGLMWIVSTPASAEEPPSAADKPSPPSKVAVRRPLGPSELPEFLPGRWKVSLCVLTPPGHAWIRYENVETGEVRTISRFHLFVGAWFDIEKFRWNYPPTTRTGVYMDREQHVATLYPPERYLLLSTYVDNPKIYKGTRDGRGHGLAVNNCVTYTRDAWHFYTGEEYKLVRIHAPSELQRQVLLKHPEVRGKASDDLAPPPVESEQDLNVRGNTPPMSGR